MRFLPTIVSLSLALCAPCFGQGFTPKILPGHVKLVKGFKPGSPELRSLPPKVVIGKDKPEAAVCGHIRVFPASKDIDPKMVVPVPEQSASRMPIHKGLPPCK